MNLCCACLQDFGSVELFDRHRVGQHAYDFLEGLRMEPAREDGRRCLDIGEMEDAGLRLNSRGRWFDPARDPRGRFGETPKLRERVA
jgi:hypothetical protein